MCGISGIVSLQPESRKLLTSLPTLLNAIKHRGPDDEGTIFFSEKDKLITSGNDTPEAVKKSKLPFTPKDDINQLNENYFVGLGHRRLSILDLSETGHQPMCDASQNYWIIYNGEIYNYKELKSELQDLGHQFVSQSDTEVLLNAYIEWGEECLHKLNGMWSFVIYDHHKNELFGARDRFGVKPFYFINNQNYFAFSSEIKSLLQIPDFKKEINPKAVYDYLVLGKLEVGDESFFKGIYELKPAHSFKLNITNANFNTNKYYELSVNQKWEKFNSKKLTHYTESTYQKVYDAIQLRLNADVKTGTCLSGGIDSSVVACVINDSLKTENKNETQELFTAVYSKSNINEEGFAKNIADITNSNWNKTNPTAQQLKEQLEDLIYYQDIPFTSSSSYSQYKVMELVNKSSIKVTLDGQGADELFGGYSPHYNASLYNSLASCSLSSLINNLKGRKNNSFRFQQLISLPIKHLFSKLFQSNYKNQLIKTQPELKFINESLWDNYAERFHLKNDEFNCNLNNLLAYQYTHYTLKHILRLADRNSMRFSVESRMPFADDIHLVESIFNISGSYKIRNGQSKYLLRNAFKQMVPKKIIERKDKIGFATPETEWFKELKPYFKEIIFEQKNDEFVDWKGIQDNFEDIYNNALTTNTQRLWRLINFALWRKIYSI
ncbi:MAG: asparagine synthase (glutamine-hydrolyzing) [Vicingus serpentipes]|nr:asparagine synthase (glutamine-hydrolyzing) [Vicingus serpentipes]